MPELLFSILSRNEENGVQFYYADYNVIKSIKPEDYDYERNTTKINLPLIIKKPEDKYRNIILDSCKGLVCFTIGHEGLDDPVCICNPATSEYISLPTIRNKTGFLVNGFGYLPSTKEYKVVRILYPDRLHHPDYATAGWVQVYTLGSSSGWRNIAAITDSLWDNGTLVNGVLYWRDDKDENIIAFDLADEVFRVLPPLPCIRPKNRYYTLRNLGGYLSWTDQVWDERIDMWLFKKNKHETRQNNVEQSEQNYYHDWSWNKEVTINRVEATGNLNFYYPFDPFALTKNNEVLLWYSDTNLLCYDPVTRSFTAVVKDNTDFGLFQGIPHVNNHASLKDLG
ncbi:F-box protein At3g07870-like [Papaver somniferum]|uniref:F-box protein At3g07870-like n=1 Tax=Papaver somniferum TaxID=3469 RepID=UPI000E6FA3F8|nr:F-box protein At3g07870-like [Papaver somniferum]